MTTKEVTGTFDPNLIVSSKLHGLLEMQLEIDVCGALSKGSNADFSILSGGKGWICHNREVLEAENAKAGWYCGRYVAMAGIMIPPQ